MVMMMIVKNGDDDGGDDYLKEDDDSHADCGDYDHVYAGMMQYSLYKL